jgi:hypothetical protein
MDPIDASQEDFVVADANYFRDASGFQVIPRWPGGLDLMVSYSRLHPAIGTHRLVGCVIASCISMMPAAAASAAKAPAVVALRVQPAVMALENIRDARRVLVSGRTKEGQWIDLSRTAKLVPASAAVTVDREGYIQPVKVGTARVVVMAGGQKTELPVTVKSVANPPVSFVREVMPIISRVGCNAGTCHGSAKGKNGFKLSLRGYDPAYDHAALIDDVSGRRFNRAEPSQSLMLLKATQGVPHQGGLIFEVGSRPYRILKQWIAEGVKLDQASRVQSLEILPAAPEMDLPGRSQQMLVIARYPDGSTRDVTRDAVYSNSVPDVATVTPEGRVTAVRRGETAILVRYEGAYATSGMLVMGDRRGFRWAEQPENNYVDRLVYQKLQRIKVLPSELCSDDEFLRRVYLDLVGLPPTPEQTRAFLKDTGAEPNTSRLAPDASRLKREAVIDRLLESPEFVDHWTNKWADLLQANRKYLGEKGVWAFRRWIQQAVASNMPYDQFARTLLTASGNSYENPAASYFRVARDTSTATENVTQLFLGVRFACAKCHDHPFEKWTQNQYYQLGAFFAQVGVKGGEDGDETVYLKPEGGEVNHPKDGRVMAAVVPVGHVSKGTKAADRRELLATWLTSAENPFFAQAMANRLWSYFLGRGIIDPVDDIRTSNPPSNPALLDALTADFVKSGFDLKHLMRTITRSRVYQHSLKANRWNERDPNFSRAEPRRLTAEQLLDSISVATGAPQKFDGIPVGFRAAQLPDSQVASGGFLDLFGRPARESPCECERTSQVSLGQALNLVNGPTIAEAIIAPEGRIARLLKESVSNRQLVEEIYLATICRLPKPAELNQAYAHLAKAGSRAEGAQDLMWALINTPAFLFNR